MLYIYGRSTALRVSLIASSRLGSTPSDFGITYKARGSTIRAELSPAGRLVLSSLSEFKGISAFYGWIF